MLVRINQIELAEEVAQLRFLQRSLRARLNSLWISRQQRRDIRRQLATISPTLETKADILKAFQGDS